MIQFMNQLFYDETPKFGNVNNTMIFIKPVYIDAIYVGSIYKLVEYTDFLAFSMFGVDKVSRTTILDTKTQRTLVDLFAQYSSPVINKNENIQFFYSYQPVIFNQLDINTNHSDYIQVAKQQVFNIVDDEIFMITDSVKYQKQFKFKEYTAINALSSIFLGSQQLLPAITCDQNSQDYIEQYNLFSYYVSNTQLNFTQLRSQASPSHIQIIEVCSELNQSLCINSNSKFLNYQKLMKEKFNNQNYKPLRCKILKQQRFTMHSYQELLLKQYKNLQNIGNISYFISQMKQLVYLVSNDRAEEGYQLPLISFVLQNLVFSTYIKSDLVYKYQVYKVDQNYLYPVMFDEIVPNDTIVVIPTMILDIISEQQNIQMFSTLTNNFQKLIQHQDVSEVVVSSLNVDNLLSQYRELFDNQYDQYLARSYNNLTSETQQLVLERIKFYKYAIEVYQLHYVSFSSGDNWEQIMIEQLKVQPSALSEKFRVGQINNKLTITKAITVQSRTLDNQTTVCGFLTVVLNQPYQFPIDEPYTLFDSNMRYIAGAKDIQFHRGVTQVLFKHNYINNIHVNYTLGNIQNILELNNRFWIDAFEQSKQKKYTVIITQNKSTYQNRISESDYNQSEIHQRSVIFDANCDYFVSGQIIVKQFGAIDGLLIIFKNVVLSNYNEELELINTNVLTVDKISYYYGNLNSRKQSTTHSTTYTFGDNKFNVVLNLSKREIIVVLYQMCIPVLMLILLFVHNFSISKPQFDYYSVEDSISTFSAEPQLNSQRVIQNHVCLIQSIQSELFYIDSTEFNSTKLIQNYIFHNDLQKYQILLHKNTHEQIYQFLLKQTETFEPNQFSFQILVSSQQYSIIMNNLMRNISWLQNQSIIFNGSLQVKFAQQNVIKMVRIYSSSKQSRIQSRVMSSSNLLQSNINQKELEIEMYVSRVFDDSNMFMDRGLKSPCKMIAFQFKSNAIKQNTNINDILKQSYRNMVNE
ncbi:Conserved_hypothetical protein [Hexamita inflata]|uniref:Transmembrane protein n=1 Tax=Hexamita inflata TaxID=28002 RepID=A0ABP1HW05_9EUKA